MFTNILQKHPTHTLSDLNLIIFPKEVLPKQLFPFFSKTITLYS
ncbi:MAG: hypothetical protein PHO23_01710 [Candidatus Pacebacteria bacterium]|nr:hypothetical protein [Candidatus Paceibacterota bacterium]